MPSEGLFTNQQVQATRPKQEPKGKPPKGPTSQGKESDEREAYWRSKYLPGKALKPSSNQPSSMSERKYQSNIVKERTAGGRRRDQDNQPNAYEGLRNDLYIRNLRTDYERNYEMI